MAEIHVEPKKQTTPAWVWILIGLVIIAAVVYFITKNNKTNETAAAHPTSYIKPQTEASAGMVYDVIAA